MSITQASYPLCVKWFASSILIVGIVRFCAAGSSLSQDTIRKIFEGTQTSLELSIPGQQPTAYVLEPADLLPTQTEFPIRALRGRDGSEAKSSLSLIVTPDSISGQIHHGGKTYYFRSARGESGGITPQFEDLIGRFATPYQCLSASTNTAAQGDRVASDSPDHFLRTFRLAPGATAEFTQFFGSREEAIREVVTAVSRANDIFFSELGISFQLVSGFERMVFTDPATDPYSSNDPTENLLRESQAAFDAMIGTENYDLGIVLTRGLYGLAQIRSVCDPAYKGASCIGIPEPTGAAFHVNLVTHELAHQFGANHTFNSPTGLCAERRNDWAAYEPGAGSTIMSYSSLPCGGDSFQPWHDAYFHSESLKEIRAFLTSGLADCGNQTLANNSAPSISAGPEYTIPIGTPFALTASAVDPDGDDILYCWEERDLGPALPLGAPDNGLSPLFRSLPPRISPTRVFPSLEHILRGTDAPDERLPQVNRMLGFRVIGRDSHQNGAISWADTQLSVRNIAGPFRIISHNLPQTLGSSARLEWNTGGTEGAPFFAPEVRITLSTNGGNSFPIVLASATANDGSEEIQVPAINSSDVRIKIEPTNNIFFDINDAPLSVASSGGLRLETSRQNGQASISWPVQPEKTYRLEHATGLTPIIWTPILTTNSGAGIISLPLSFEGSCGYYRIVEE